MKLLAVIIEDQETGNSWRDEIPDSDLNLSIDVAEEHGCTLRVIGAVSVEQQLARMENNPGAI